MSNDITIKENRDNDLKFRKDLKKDKNENLNENVETEEGTIEYFTE